MNSWIEGQNLGTTADENCNYSLTETDNSKSIVFSAVGYGKKCLKAAEASGILYLIPQAIEVNDVVIENRRNSNEITIGSIKNIEKTHYFGMHGTNPWMYANFYENKPEYASAPYLKKVKIITKAEHNGASFNVRFYDVDENGKPGDFLYDENIICYPKKGSREYTIDTSKLNIRFPEKGLFIALEWLIIDQNRYEWISKFKTDADGKSVKLNPKDYVKGYAYTPAFGITHTEEIISWVYIDGKWGTYKKREWCLAMELTLTN